MGRGRRRRSNETLIPDGLCGDDPIEAAAKVEGEGEAEEKGFFACYLLRSLSPRHKGQTYIGFTVNPRRRIRQHNGEITSGAWRTKRKRPWEMVMCIYGFHTNVNALQFEWAWQHPRKSVAVREAVESFKSLSGVANKIKIAYTMLTLPNWENLNLTINFFSTKYMKHTVGCPKLPKNMRVNMCAMDELPCYMNGQTLDDDGDEFDDYEVSRDEDDKLSESTNTPPDPCEGDKNLKERMVFDDHDLPSKSDGNAYSVDSFIQSPVKTYDGYSWQIEYNNNIQQTILTDPCPATPIKPVDGGGIAHNYSYAPNSSDAAIQSSLGDMSGVSIEPSTPMTSGADNNARKLKHKPPPNGYVINLLTPSSCTIHLENTRAPVRRQIIDLTESPEVIHL